MKENDISQLDLENTHKDQIHEKNDEHKNEIELCKKNYQKLLDDQVNAKQCEIDELKAKTIG